MIEFDKDLFTLQSDLSLKDVFTGDKYKFLFYKGFIKINCFEKDDNKIYLKIDLSSMLPLDFYYRIISKEDTNKFYGIDPESFNMNDFIDYCEYFYNKFSFLKDENYISLEENFNTLVHEIVELEHSEREILEKMISFYPKS